MFEVKPSAHRSLWSRPGKLVMTGSVHSEPRPQGAEFVFGEFNV